MMINKTFSLLLLMLLGFLAIVQAQELPAALSPYFKAPDSLANDYGSFRSVLKFNDGRPVLSTADWQLRRQEIKSDWQRYLGIWPSFDETQELTYGDSVQREGYMQYTVRFMWAPQQWTRGYLLVPSGGGAAKRAAVVTVFYEAETAIGAGKPNRDFALQLVRQGFITLSLGTREASARQEFSIYYPSIDSVSVQPLSMLGYAANAAYYALSHRKDVDVARIGIVGHSFGGKWAMFAACLSDNFAAAAWSDPGIVMQEDRPSINYWEPWYLGFHAKPWRQRGLISAAHPAYGVYEQLRREGRNLHELHALMAPRPFLVSGGAEDPITQWRALNHSVSVNSLLGYSDRVAMSNRPLHEPNAESNAIIVSFFKHFLLSPPQ